MAEVVVRTWVHRLGLFPLGVVGQRDVDDAGAGLRLDVFGSVHRRRADRIGGPAGIDQHACGVGEAVGRREPRCAVGQDHCGAVALRHVELVVGACRDLVEVEGKGSARPAASCA